MNLESQQSRSTLEQGSRNEPQLCLLCQKYETDSVKTGRWSYDLFCLYCIDRKHCDWIGMGWREYQKTYRKITPEMEPLLALACIADRIRKDAVIQAKLPIVWSEHLGEAQSGL